MKKIGEYTTKGTTISDSTSHRIILDDGSFKTGYRVVEFVVAAHDMDNSSARVYSAKLMTDDDTSIGVNWNWDDNAEIAWAAFNYDGNAPGSLNTFSQVDPDNLVIQDLFIRVEDGASGSGTKVNYFIRMEKYEITDWRGALSMVRNRSQA